MDKAELLALAIDEMIIARVEKSTLDRLDRTYDELIEAIRRSKDVGQEGCEDVPADLG